MTNIEKLVLYFSKVWAVRIFEQGSRNILDPKNPTKWVLTLPNCTFLTCANLRKIEELGFIPYMISIHRLNDVAVGLMLSLVANGNDEFLARETYLKSNS